MNFSEALKAMKMGNKVSREAWRGKISYWIMDEEINEPSIHEYGPDGKHIRNFDDVNLVDILAEDWWLVT